MTLCSGYIRERKPRSIDTVVFVTVDHLWMHPQMLHSGLKMCFFSIHSLDFFSQGEVLRGYGGFQAAAALPQFALVAEQCHFLQGGGSRRCRLHLGLWTRSAPWE